MSHEEEEAPERFELVGVGVVVPTTHSVHPSSGSLSLTVGVWFAGHVVEEPEVHLARRPETTGWASSIQQFTSRIICT
jgi:hypothetical protein